MQLITCAGPPSSGKTSILSKVLSRLSSDGCSCGVVKFDCLSTNDDCYYQKVKIPVAKGLSGALCPDHYFVSNINEVIDWAKHSELQMVVTESAGLCNRCSPYIKGSLAVCIIDNLLGIDTPGKIGPMIKFADLIIITKGDIVSQTEREVFAFRVHKVAPNAMVANVNGLNGQGIDAIVSVFKSAAHWDFTNIAKLRFPMPAALCSYCLGETRIGPDYQIGNGKKLIFKK